MTSEALVGSSAIKSLGLVERAVAIITLWRIPPVVFFVLMILAFVLVGDGLRDAADPYSEDGR